MRFSWSQIIVLGLILGLAQAAVRLIMPEPLLAQGAGGTLPPGVAVVVATCGTGPSYTAGSYAFVTIDTTGKFCTSL